MFRFWIRIRENNRLRTGSQTHIVCLLFLIWLRSRENIGICFAIRAVSEYADQTIGCI